MEQEKTMLRKKKRHLKRISEETKETTSASFCRKLEVVASVRLLQKSAPGRTGFIPSSQGSDLPQAVCNCYPQPTLMHLHTQDGQPNTLRKNF